MGKFNKTGLAVSELVSLKNDVVVADGLQKGAFHELI